jgi:hypothetical protein
MIVFDNKLKLVSRFFLGLIFSTLIIIEIFESFLYGLINTIDYDLLVLSVIGLILTIFGFKLSKVIISLILGYFVWELSTQHFPAYPEYQAFTFLFNIIGVKSIGVQKVIHIVGYSVLIIVLYLPRKGKLKKSGTSTCEM